MNKLIGWTAKAAGIAAMLLAIFGLSFVATVMYGPKEVSAAASSFKFSDVFTGAQARRLTALFDTSTGHSHDGTDSRQIAAGGIATGAVNTDKLASAAVNWLKIVDGSIDSSKLAASAVIASKIAAGAVDTAALGSGAVTVSKIGALAVATANIAALAVDTAKIAVNAIDTTKLLFVGTVDSPKYLCVTQSDLKIHVATVGDVLAGLCP